MKCDGPSQVVRMQWQDDFGPLRGCPIIDDDQHVCLGCGFCADICGGSVSQQSLEDYRKKHGHLVSRKGCVDQSLIRTRSAHKNSQFTVKYNCDQKTKDMLFDKMLEWFIAQGVFKSEYIMQSDGAWGDTPTLFSEISEDIFDFDATWVDEEE